MKTGLGTLAVALALCGAGLGWLRFSGEPEGHLGGSETSGQRSHATKGGATSESYREVQARPKQTTTPGRMAGPEPVLRYLRSDNEGRLGIIHEWAYPPDGEGFPDGIAELLSELHAKEAGGALRQELLDALVWVASGASFDAILEISKSASDEEQRAAATSALEQVIEALASDEKSMAWDRVFRGTEADLPREVRVTAIQAVKNDGNASMIPRLEVIARDADPGIREAAQEAVEWLREE